MLSAYILSDGSRIAKRIRRDASRHGPGLIQACPNIAGVLILSQLQPLPIDSHLSMIVETMEEHGTVVLKAPPGAGKTTRLPPALLDAGKAGSGRIVVLEPRRIAARSAALRIARERGQKLGHEVGYQVRFDHCHGPDTRILLVTEGILTRWLQQDPFLEGIACVLIDEFHERSLHADLALSFLKEVRREARPDLMIGVMSATLDPTPISDFLDKAPIIDIPVTRHPLEITYLNRRDTRPLPIQAAAGIARALDENRTKGDLLVFLPGMGEIVRTREILESSIPLDDVMVVPLHGELPIEQQDHALEPQQKRKIILSTNVAETSLTIEGVDTVIDSGYARVLRHDPRYGMDRLERVRISRSSADQRAGRAGRTGPGRAFRLWTRSEDAVLAPETVPEIMRVDLAATVLEVLAWGTTDVERFPWFQRPPKSMIRGALELLRRLGAIRGAPVRLTEMGERMLALPLAPRLARILIESARQGCLHEGSLMAALLSERDILAPDQRQALESASTGSSDLLLRLDLLREAEKNGMKPAALHRLGTKRGAIHAVLKAASQFRRIAGRFKEEGKPQKPSSKTLARVLLAGYPDRVAIRRSQGNDDFLMVGGRGATLSRYSVVRDSELLLAVDVEGGQKGRQAQSLIHMACALERDWLENDFPDLMHVEEIFRFDEKLEKVQGARTVLFDDLALEERALTHLEPMAASRMLEEAAAKDMEKALHFDKAAASFRERIRFLNHWMPELELPELDEEDLRSLLPAICANRKSFQETRDVKLLPLLKGLLTHTQLAAVEEHAPERISIPGGRTAALHYEPSRPPRLAIRIQQLFGMRKAPLLAKGRVSILFDLLGPNMRTVQLTEDIESFWKNTYAQVRKDLRGRYPKHHWPEDPMDIS